MLYFLIIKKMNKIFWYFVLIFTVYILIIFNFPTFAAKIWDTFWLTKFNQFVLQFKSTYDKTVTNIPHKDEIQDIYNKTYSWATIIKENVETSLEATKEKVDNVRLALSWAETKINEIQDWIESVKTVIERGSEIINEASQTVNTLSWAINDITTSDSTETSSGTTTSSWSTTSSWTTTSSWSTTN